MNSQYPNWPPEENIIIGVDPSGNIVLGDKGILERVAEISPYTNGGMLRDLGGSIPILLNGQEVSGRIPLQASDIISIGTWRWTVPQSASGIPGKAEHFQRQTCIHKSSEGLRIHAENLSYTVTVRKSPTSSPRQLQLLKNVSLTIQPGEFVGIVGASGSGKSTLLRTLNGDYTPQSGRVMYDGVPAGSFLAKSPGRLAYLPQDLILHNELTPKQALKYTARLRGISDADNRVKDVLKQVGLSEHADKKIRNLSGGQKKRAGLATELLSRPEALFLDEATSGLDPLGEKEMMRLFRGLADSGITVVCITHFPGQLNLCDRILAMDKGKLVLNDSPEQILAYLDIPSFEDIYDKLTTLPPVSVKSEEHPEQKRGKNGSKQQSTLTALEQMAILFQRYAYITLKDWKTLLLYIIQPPVISGLIGLTFGNIVTGFAERHATDIKQVAFLLLLAILWCSSMNGVREIIKERNIFAHERRFGLSPVAYLASKYLLLGIIGVGQAIVLALVLCAITGLHANGPMALAIIVLVGLAGTALGLTVSSVVQSSERAMTILPIILIGQAVYSGGLANMTGMNRVAAILFSSSYWGLEGLKSLLPNNLLYATYPSAVGHYQPPILGVPLPYPIDLCMLLVQTSILLIISWVFVRKIRA